MLAIHLTKVTPISCGAAVGGGARFGRGPGTGGLDRYGLLREAEEQLPAMTSAASIEPEGEFVQVVVQMRLRHRPLVSA